LEGDETLQLHRTRHILLALVHSYQQAFEVRSWSLQDGSTSMKLNSYCLFRTEPLKDMIQLYYDVSLWMSLNVLMIGLQNHLSIQSLLLIQRARVRRADQE